MNAARQLRPPGVAGSFYPADPAQLRTDVDRMLAAAHVPRLAHARILLAPHAGYMYSGVTAAHSYRLLADKPPGVAVIIGPSHYDAFAYTSVFDGAGYETPLGVAPVDRDTAEALAMDSTSIRLASAGHTRPGVTHKEHGIEVQLPFLQRVAPGARIVPIVMGDQSWDPCVELGDRIALLLERDDVVIIVSSDLSHFYDHDAATRKDEAFCRRIKTLDPAALYGAVQSGECEACGAGPMVAALIANAEREAVCQILARTDSSEVTGDVHSVVGYAAAVISARGATS